MRKYVPVTLSLALAMPIFACGGNNEGGNTNTDTQCHGPNCGHVGPDSDPSKNKESTITKINQGLIQKNTEVSIEAVVTAVEEYTAKNAETGKYEPTGISGFFVSDIIDQAAPYTGIFAKYPQSGEVGAVAIGDIVKLKGIVDEYYGAKQIKISDVKKTSTHSLPAPAVIKDLAKISTKFTYSDADGFYSIGTSGADAAKYVGVLVKVENVTSTVEKVSTLNASGKNCKDANARPLTDEGCTANSGFEVNDTLVVANENMYYVPNALRKVGTKFTSITGIMDYNYSAYVLLPRIEGDVVAEKGSNTDSDNTDDDGNSEREYAETAIDDIQAGEVADNTFVKVDGVVVSHTSAPFENSLSFYIADEDGNAIFVYSANSEGVTGIEKGKKVTVTGSIAKFTSNKGEKMTQMEVKGAGKPAITVNGSGEEKVIEMTLPVNESSRGKLATFKDLTVKEAADDYCNGGTATNYCTATLTDGTNDIKVKYLKIDDNDKDYSNLKKLIGDNFSTQNDVFSSVTGILDVSYGDIVLFPRTQDDIVEAQTVRE